jgi:hypothetical protein
MYTCMGWRLRCRLTCVGLDIRSFFSLYPFLAVKKVWQGRGQGPVVLQKRRQNVWILCFQTKIEDRGQKKSYNGTATYAYVSLKSSRHSTTVHRLLADTDKLQFGGWVNQTISVCLGIARSFAQSIASPLPPNRICMCPT